MLLDGKLLIGKTENGKELSILPQMAIFSALEDMTIRSRSEATE